MSEWVRVVVRTSPIAALLFVSLGSLAACGAPWSGYRDVGSKALDGDRLERLPGGFVFEQESASSGVIVSDPYEPGSAFVPCHVERYGFDQRFIVARQVAGTRCWPETLGDDAERVGVGTHYWVIELQNRTVQGPMDRGAIEAWARTNAAQVLLEGVDRAR